MKETILVPYAPILVESTRSIGYSFESAMADIIDNSIGKGATRVDIIFQSINPQYIAIIDNACGMTEEELLSAMRYGSQSSLDARDSKDLGRFGLGLKMASMSQCRRLTVITKKSGVINSARWDLDHIIAKGDWSLLCLSSEDIKEIPHSEKLDELDAGTIVLWECFDKIASGASNPQKIFDEKIQDAREHVALVFHRFMDEENISGRVTITFNGEKVEPKDPFLRSNPATQPLPENNIPIEKEEIRVKAFVLPYITKMTLNDRKQIGDTGELRQRQGFYIYRNKRLIIWGTWFKLLRQYELNKLARVRVDIPNSLDHLWEIDVKKSTATLPDRIKVNLVAVVEETVGKSEKVYRYRGRKVDDSSIVHAWDLIKNRTGFEYVINKNFPFYKALEEQLDKKGVAILKAFINSLEDGFPYEDVYYRKGKNETLGNEDNELSEEEVYEMGINLIEHKKSRGESIEELLRKMPSYEVFAKRLDIVEKLRGEFLNENQQ